ncbi:MAG: alkaline phosphatase family protein [Imperialibacter sp.]|uniref:alkaline phosphatase family protein n=1 Tax=Imperialibacter sp. TaxID=2038411 RepID=UPI003A854719
MKNLLVFLLFIMASAGAFSQKVVFVIIDGVEAEVFERVATPNMDAIAKTGGYTRAYVGGERGGYSETPTISAPGYNNLITGTWGNKHNVWGNSIKAPNYNYWSAFRFVEELAPAKETAIFSTWLDNRTKLVGEGLQAAGNVMIDYHFDGFELDEKAFPHDKERLFIHNIDEHVVNDASRYIKEKGPDFSWVYLEYTDDMGHAHGNSEKTDDAIHTADDQMGRIWEAIQYRQKEKAEQWMMFITTDHGRSAESGGKDHGGQSDRERTTWIVMGGGQPNAYFTKEQNAIVDILPTALNFMGIPVPRERAYELDGVPLVGKVSIAQPKTDLAGDKLRVSWKAIDLEGDVKILLATTDNFEAGGTDVYTEVGTAKAGAEVFEIDLSRYPSDFYKVVIEGRYNSVGRWVKR